MKRKNWISSGTLVIILIFFGNPLRAAPLNVTIISVSTEGEGCPQETTQVNISPNQNALSILFDQTLVESTGQNPISHALCEITLVSYVPAGLALSLHTTDLRGFAAVDPGSQSQIKTRYFKNMPSGKWDLIKKIKKKFGPGINENYLSHQLLKSRQPAVVKYRDHLETIKIQIQMISRSKSKDFTFAQLALDSLDLTVEGIQEVCSNEVNMPEVD